MITVEDGTDPFATIIAKLADLAQDIRIVKEHVRDFQQLPEITAFVAAYSAFIGEVVEMANAIENELTTRVMLHNVGETKNLQ